MAGLLDRHDIMSQVVDPNISNRGMLLPIGRHSSGAITMAWPQALLDFGKAMMLPGDVARGVPYKQSDVTDLAANLAGGGYASGLLAGPKGGATLGMNVWHGGPNRWMPESGFPQGRPRLDRVGTGEGAQAYGHGFYSAESKGVGQEYATALAQRKLLVDGQENTSQLLKSAMTTQGSPEEYIKQAKVGLRHVQDRLNKADKSDTGLGFSEYDLLESEYKTRVKNIAELEQYIGKEIKFGNISSLKKLDLPDEDIAKMLDWDAPLSEQPASVQRGIQALVDAFPEVDDIQKLVSATGKLRTGVNGESVLRVLRKHLGESKASAVMAGQGIPGLKYYDQMSREGARSTRNYVTWDQDVLDRTKILENH